MLIGHYQIQAQNMFMNTTNNQVNPLGKMFVVIYQNKQCSGLWMGNDADPTKTYQWLTMKNNTIWVFLFSHSTCGVISHLRKAPLSFKHIINVPVPIFSICAPAVDVCWYANTRVIQSPVQISYLARGSGRDSEHVIQNCIFNMCWTKRWWYKYLSGNWVGDCETQQG